MTRTPFALASRIRRAAWCALTVVLGSAAALALLALLSPVRPAAAAPLVFPGCGPSIQACLNAASNGDSLTIAPGTYVTSFTLNKAVSLLGAGPASVRLQALAGQRVLTVTGGVISNSVVISGLTFTGGNLAGDSCPAACGAGILITGSARPLLHNLVVATNTAGYNGGGVYAHQFSTVYIEDSLFLNNAATYQGGGLWSAFNLATIINSRFENNRVDAAGGGAWMNGFVTLIDTDLVSNTADLIGGGAAIYYVTVSGGEISRNYCTVTGCVGGGLYLGGASYLTGAEFVSNTADYGGGIYAVDAMTLTTVTFLTNIANDTGGGVFLDTEYYEGSEENLVVVDSAFDNNSAVEGAGAVYAGGLVTVTGGHMNGNHTVVGTTGGGALVANGPLSIERTAFVGNWTQGPGGALLAYLGPGSIANVLFANNGASSGAAIAVNGVHPISVLHSTITSGTVGSSSAIYVNSGTVGVTNTIITNYATGIDIVGGSGFEDYNLFFNVATLTNGATSGGHSFTANPLFVNAGAGDYHLALGSPAASAGTNVGVKVDFDGGHRPMGLGFDIGFDELIQPIYTFIPLVVR